MNAHIDPRKINEYRKLLQYELRLQDAEAHLIDFAEVTMPIRNALDDAVRTRYLRQKHHEFMADVMEAVERRDVPNVILNLPPRHGKSELCTIRNCAWYTGRNPDHDVIVATYGSTFAKDFGLQIQRVIESQRYQQVFPDYFLTKTAADNIVNMEGSNLYFLGRRSPTNGRGGNLILVDDPTKDDKEASSVIFRNDLWQWFTQTLLARRIDDRSPVVLTQTRWNEDDIVGRITDKTNPVYSKELADEFEVIDVPAICESPNDPMGRKIGEALWASRFGLKYLNQMKAANPVAFSALYQSNPTPEEGVFYSKDEITEYEAHELPESLTIYAASDHAVGTAAINDPTCMGPFGVCPNGIAWVLPRLKWYRMDSLKAVNEMCDIIENDNPVFWYAEKGHISKSLKPVLRKEMAAREIFCPFIEDHPSMDKIQRAQSARALCANGKIRFPKFAPWWQRAKNELLKFPNGRNDDFVDFVSIIGMKTMSQVAASRKPEKTVFPPGSFGALRAEFAEQDRQARSRGGY